jgi:DNA-binding response OmpR family regulator
MSRVLIVDDSALFSQVLIGLFADMGITACGVRDLDGVSSDLQPGMYDLALVDLYLEEANGLDVCRLLRGVDPDLPIILMTARPEGLELRETLGPFADDFFVKTNSLAELVGRVTARLSQRAALRASRHREAFLEGIVALADHAMSYRDLGELRDEVARELLQLPGVLGVWMAVHADDAEAFVLLPFTRAGLDAEPPPSAIERITAEKTSFSTKIEGDALEVAPLGRGPTGVFTLRRPLDAPPLDPTLLSTLGGLLWGALLGVRRQDMLKKRQSRIERSYLERRREAEHLSGRLSRLAAIRDDFLRVMSHDLRSPVSVILGASQLLDEELLGPLNPKQKVYLDTIRKHADRLRAMIEEMLDRRRSTDTVVPTALQPLDLAALLLEEVERLGAAAAAKSQHVRLELEDGVLVDGDASALRETASALIENAIGYGPEGSDVRVTLERQDGNALIVISDDGPGFSHSASARGSPLLTDTRLRFALATIRAHGGSYQLEKRSPGGGSARFTIPLSTGLGDLLDILLASANLDRLDEIENELGRYWSVSCVTSARDLQDRVRSSAPGVLILDHQVVGGVSSVSLLHGFKLDPRSSGMPVVFIAPPDRPDLAESARRAGAVSVLSLPVDISLLMREVREAARRNAISAVQGAPTRDPLTGLEREAQAVARIRRLREECRRAGAAFTGLFLELCGVMEMERLHGRAGLDHLLLHLSRFLREESLVGETLYRVADARFLMLLPRIPLPDAEARARSMAERIREIRPRLGTLRVTLDVEAHASDLTRHSPNLDLHGGGPERGDQETWQEER